MSGTHADEDYGLPPGDEDNAAYEATAFVRGGGRGGAGWLWFVCRDGNRDRIEALANLREMEPGELGSGVAWLHFSGLTVVLKGQGIRRVVHRIFLGRCSSVHEIKPGQRLKKAGDPVVESITFLVPPPPEREAPRHEPETRRKAGAEG